MANHPLPRRGSAAANALVTLDGAGGKLTLVSWRAILGWKGSPSQFDQNVVERLRRAGPIVLVAGQASMAPAGHKFVGLKGVEVAAEPAQLAGPRYVAPIRQLNPARRGPPRPVRAGAFDYMQHPSRMGAESVAYKGATSFVGDVQ